MRKLLRFNNSRSLIFVGAKKLFLLKKGVTKYLYFSYHIFLRFEYFENTVSELAILIIKLSVCAVRPVLTHQYST